MKRAIGPMALAVLGAFSVHWLVWGSFEGFTNSIDFNAGALEDFMGPYLEMARIVQDGTRTPAVQGFVYTPFFAWLISPLGSIDPGTASWIWLGVQVLSILALLLLPLRFVRNLSMHERAVFVFATLVAFPLAHNLHWGQVSTPLWALALLAVGFLQRGRVHRAACVLGLAGAIKFFPWALALIFPMRRQVRPLLSAGAVGLVFAVGVPLLVFGLAFTVDIYDFSFDQVEANLQGAWDGSPNRQDLAQVLGRWTGLEDAGRWLQALALLGFAGAVWCGQRVARRAGELDTARAFAILTCGLLLALPPGWPHYFVHLPFVQLVAWRTRCDRLDGGLVLASAALASVVPMAFVDSYDVYTGSGALAVANVLVLVALVRGSAADADPES